MSDSQRRPGENETAYKSRQARERGAAGRRAAEQRGEAIRQPAVARGEEIRREPVFKGKRERSKAELRGAMRRIDHMNKLQPPPQTPADAGALRKLEEASPMRKVLGLIDSASSAVYRAIPKRKNK